MTTFEIGDRVYALPGKYAPEWDYQRGTVLQIFDDDYLFVAFDKNCHPFSDGKSTASTNVYIGNVALLSPLECLAEAADALRNPTQV